jgi:hypothetical protein
MPRWKFLSSKRLRRFDAARERSSKFSRPPCPAFDSYRLAITGGAARKFAKWCFTMNPHAAVEFSDSGFVCGFCQG